MKDLAPTAAEQLPAATKDAPTMSEALAAWLEENAMIPRGIIGKSLNDNESLDEIIAELVADYDRCAQAGLAFRVRQGFRLLQIRSLDDQRFETVLKERDIPRSVAQRDMDACRLFNQLGDLALLRRAEALGLARIRELKPHLGLDGICALIEGKEVDTLRYDAALGMSHRDIVAWRKQRLNLAIEKAADRMGLDLPPAAERAAPEPLALTVARDELLAAAQRAQLEVDRAKTVFEALLRNPQDEWKPARMEVAHATHQLFAASIAALQALDEALVTRFGVLVTRPAEGEYQTMPYSAVTASAEAVAADAEQDAYQRAKARAARLKLRGAPPKQLDRVIAQALHLDTERDHG